MSEQTVIISSFSLPSSPPHPLTQVTAGKNEVTLEFHQSDEASQSLVEMRFHMPTSAQADPEEDQAKVGNNHPACTWDCVYNVALHIHVHCCLSILNMGLLHTVCLLC